MKEGEQLPELKFLDHVFLTGLVLLVAMDVYILSFPPPQDIQVVGSATSQQRTIAVLDFEDLELAKDGDPIGEVFAGELRSSLTRTAGLRVLGPETSKLLRLASENRLLTANELLVTALVLGEVLLEGGRIQVNARLVGIPAGNQIWSTSVEAPVGDAIELKQGLLKQLIGAIAPNLDPDPVQGPRAEAGECSAVYDIYLRGKQISKWSRKSDQYKRGVGLLRQAVAIDDQCALAWEALASASVDWTMPGFVKASVAARRALELNDALPEAWAVLAEIAEEEARWTESEEYFLRALYADPTNAHVNGMYSEALVARGRVTEALRYALEAYRFEPASLIINWRVAIAAIYAGDADLTIKHAEVMMDIRGDRTALLLDFLGEGYLLKGETDRAIDAYTERGDFHADWFPDCVRVRDAPGQAAGLIDTVRETLDQYKAGQLTDKRQRRWGWSLIRCGAWLGEPDIVFDVLFAEGVPPFEEGMSTEVIFINMFHPDGAVLRQDLRFRELVMETGLLDYWRQWGWSDYCEPEGDSFRCD